MVGHASIMARAGVRRRRGVPVLPCDDELAAEPFGSGRRDGFRVLAVAHLAAQLLDADAVANVTQWFLMPVLAAIVWLSPRRRARGW
ncbi:hypothetical protein GS421_11325 [Rhodococcus hoagii]|nr:hypothetical protein [Prescottella equi]